MFKTILCIVLASSFAAVSKPTKTKGPPMSLSKPKFRLFKYHESVRLNSDEKAQGPDDLLIVHSGYKVELSDEGDETYATFILKAKGKQERLLIYANSKAGNIYEWQHFVLKVLKFEDFGHSSKAIEFEVSKK